ncbi:MAG: hypothetical protein KGM43_00645 [Planctomycetota bacterium]|nr:hypothetical protein [Planctomycetota bacterium]
MSDGPSTSRRRRLLASAVFGASLLCVCAPGRARAGCGSHFPPLPVVAAGQDDLRTSLVVGATAPRTLRIAQETPAEPSRCPGGICSRDQSDPLPQTPPPAPPSASDEWPCLIEQARRSTTQSLRLHLSAANVYVNPDASTLDRPPRA